MMQALNAANAIFGLHPIRSEFPSRTQNVSGTGNGSVA
jgi:hypothetical protein